MRQAAKQKAFRTNKAHFILAACIAVVPVCTQASDDNDDMPGLFIPSNTAAKNFYGGISFGTGSNDYPNSNQDGSVTGVSEDKRDTVYSFFGGYQLSDNFAIEGGYTDFGDSTFAGTSSGGPSWEAGPVSALHESDGWQLGVLGRWPITNRWYALGYVGWLWWESKETFVETSATTTVTESGSDGTFAIGLEWDAGLKDRILYRFMGSHSQVGEPGYDINTASGEIVYRFP
jgi:hypothetical protein